MAGSPPDRPPEPGVPTVDMVTPSRAFERRLRRMRKPCDGIPLTRWDRWRLWWGYRQIEKDCPLPPGAPKHAIYLQKEAGLWREIGHHRMANLLQHAAEDLMYGPAPGDDR